MAGATVGMEVDTRVLDAVVNRVDRNVTVAAHAETERFARDVADKLQAKTPVLTGRLRASAKADATVTGAEVHYGEGIPYATYIAHRTNNVTDATTGVEPAYVEAMRKAAWEATR